MKILNSTIDPNKAFVHVISGCDTNFIRGAHLTIKKPANGSAAEVLMSNLKQRWDKINYPSFLYLVHYDSNGSKIFEELYETVEDFPNNFGEYFICPKCSNVMIRIEALK